MITSAKNYTKKTKKQKKDRQTVPQDKWWKQSYTDKITQRSIHIHTDKKRKRKKKSIYQKKKGEQPNQ